MPIIQVFLIEGRSDEVKKTLIEKITAAIVDWRAQVDQLHPSPFDSFYLSRSPSFIGRHASFQESEELLLVKGMTAELYYGSSLDKAQAGLRDCLSTGSARQSSSGSLGVPCARNAPRLPGHRNAGPRDRCRHCRPASGSSRR